MVNIVGHLRSPSRGISTSDSGKSAARIVRTREHDGALNRFSSSGVPANRARADSHARDSDPARPARTAEKCAAETGYRAPVRSGA